MFRVEIPQQVYLHLQTALHVSGGDTTTSLFTSADCSTCFGWYLHLKHVEQFADINKLYIVASCWIIIDTHKL